MFWLFAFAALSMVLAALLTVLTFFFFGGIPILIVALVLFISGLMKLKIDRKSATTKIAVSVGALLGVGLVYFSLIIEGGP